MAIPIRIPRPLRFLTGGLARVEGVGGTLADLFADLDKQFNGFSKRLMHAQEQPARAIQIFVNEQDIQTLHGFQTPMAEGDVVCLVPVIAGGADVSQKIIITVSGDDVNEPIIYTLGKWFDLIPNIDGATISGGVGIVALELTGAQEEVDKAIAFLQEKGISVEMIT